MRKRFFLFTAAMVLAAANTGAAQAHSSLETGTAKLGAYKAVMRIPHGCEGQATNTVRIEIPEGYIGVKPMPKAGWSIELEKGDYAKSYDIYGEKVTSGVKAVIWSGGDLPDEFYDEFVVRGTLADLEPGSKLAFVTTQTCKDGKVEWKDIAKEGEDPHALKSPAPLLEIIAGADEHAGHNMAMAAPSSAMSEPVMLGPLKISNGWIKAMLPGQPVGGGYLTVENTGNEADRLVSVHSSTSPDVEIHEMKIENDVMKMRQLTDGMEIPAGSKIELMPGGNHLMFMGVTTPFKQGDVVKVVLSFAKAGDVEIEFPVGAAGGK